MSLVDVFARWMGLNEDSFSNGRRVGVRDALGVPPAWYAHNKLTGDFGRLPIDVKRKVGEGSINDIEHDGYYLLREQPNKIQAPTTFKEQILSHALMKGNGRAAIIRTSRGISELIPMMPDATWTIIYEGEKYHITKPENQSKRDLFDTFDTDKNGYLIFHDSDVLHLTGFSWDGVEGLGLLDIANATFATGHEETRFKLNQLRRGFRGKLFLEAPPAAFRKAEDAKEFIDDFNKIEAGSENSAKAGLLREGIKANAVSMNNNDAQFAALQKLTRQEVGMLFGLEGMPGDGDSVSYNSLEQKQLAYLQCLDHWLVKFEEQCDIKLRTPRERRSGEVYFKFNAAALYRTDLRTTMESFSRAIASRIMNPNECRAKLDLNPYDGGNEFINPAISTPTGEQSADEVDDIPEDEQEGEQEDSQDSRNDRAVEQMLRDLIKTEGNNAINASKKAQFVAWIGKNYPKWQNKLADKIEAIGLDRDLARIHCEKSTEILASLAAKHGGNSLQKAVETEVKSWENRVFELKGAQK
jgi:HK97 family phage portal protein